MPKRLKPLQVKLLDLIGAASMLRKLTMKIKGVIMTMKHVVALASMWVLLGLASPPVAFAQIEQAPQTDVDVWNDECKEAWADAPAASSCQATSDGEPRHVRIENNQNICWLKVECAWTHPVAGPASSTREFEARKGLIRQLKNCRGLLLPTCTGST